jgi:hypothetical protein
MSENWMILGYESDPVPGDPGVVRKFAADYAGVAQAIADASTRLRSIADRQDSESEFISKFRSQASEVATDIDKAHERYAGVAGAMAGYAPSLEEAQTRAKSALNLAQGSSPSFQLHTMEVNKYTQDLQYDTSLTPDERQHFTLLLHTAQHQLDAATQDLAHAKTMLQSAIDERDAAASRASGKIQNVQDSGGINDSPWQQFWDRNGKWISNAVNILEDIGSVVLIVLAFVPGVDLIVAVIVIALAVVEIANAAMQWSAGTMSATEAITDIALSVLSIVGVGVGLRVMKTATNAAVRTSMASKAAQGFSGFTKDGVTAAITEGMEATPKAGILRTLMTNEPEKVDQLKNLANMALVKSGTSARIAKIAGDGATLLKFFPGPVPEALLDRGTHEVENILSPDSGDGG